MSTKKPFNNEIWYTNGSSINASKPSDNAFNADILSNLYYIERDCWVIKFTHPVTSIEYEAFMGCEDLISIIVPDTLNEIGLDAFKGCKNLMRFYGKSASDDGRCIVIDGALKAFAPAGITEYSIPDNVTCIDEFVFSGCDNLKSVTIPEYVSIIKDQSFSYCKNLSEVYCMATKPPMLKVESLSPDVVYGTASNIKFYVSNESVCAYKKSWREYADNIIGYDFKIKP